MNYERLDYVTGDRTQRFDFVFMDCGPQIGWRVYIINKINYKFRSRSSHATHRLHAAGETYKYICWNHRINTIEEAKNIAAVWADATAQYIKTGRSFDDIVRQM